jgi:hypothetical protein
MSGSFLDKRRVLLPLSNFLPFQSDADAIEKNESYADDATTPGIL